jgi:hypothetical protein
LGPCANTLALSHILELFAQQALPGALSRNDALLPLISADSTCQVSVESRLGVSANFLLV